MLSLVPQVQAAVDTTAFGNFVSPIIVNIVDPVVELMFSIGIIVFVWGIVEMIVNADDPDARGKGRRHMLSGLIGMVIMLSAWGIIYVISNTVKAF